MSSWLWIFPPEDIAIAVVKSMVVAMEVVESMREVRARGSRGAIMNQQKESKARTVMVDVAVPVATSR